jgi:hypothetical protein
MPGNFKNNCLLKKCLKASASQNAIVKETLA